VARVGRSLLVIAAIAVLTGSLPSSVPASKPTGSSEPGVDGPARMLSRFRSAMRGDVTALMKAAPDGAASEAASTLLHNLRTISDEWRVEAPAITADSFAVTVRSQDLAYRVVGTVDTASGGLESIGAIPVAVDAPPGVLDVGYSIDEMTPHGCRQVTAGGPDIVPLASVAKVALLAALAERVDAGEVSLDDAVEIEPRVRSLPSGTWQRLPDGTVRSVLEAARAAFLHSDNTAADLLLDVVGRERMDRSAEATGLSGGYESTSELFKLGWSDPSLADRIRGLTPAEQRSFLETVPLPSAAVVEGESIHDRSLGWRGRSAGVCEAWSTLMGTTLWGELAPEVGSIDFAAIGCRDVAFKAGRGPGISTLSGVLEAAGGDRLVVTVSVESAGSEDEVQVWSAAQALAEINRRGVITCADGRARVDRSIEPIGGG